MKGSKKTTGALALSWGLCLGMLLALVLAAQLLALHDPISPERWLYSAREDTTVNRVVALRPPADILVIGNSRAREAVISPMMCVKLGLPYGSVRNYGIASGSAVSSYALTLLLERSGKMPRVLICPVSPRDLAQGGLPATAFLPLADALELRGLPPGSFRELLIAALQRNVAALWIREAVMNPAIVRTPALGDTTGNLLAHYRAVREDRELSYAAHPPTPSELAGYIRCSELGGASTFDNRACTCAERLIQVAHRAGCAVIVVELPLASGVREGYPEGIYDDFLRIFREDCRSEGVTFLTLADLGVTFTDADIGDATHCNWSGASKFTTALVPFIAKALHRAN